jgi:hypothetical protein
MVRISEFASSTIPGFLRELARMVADLGFTHLDILSLGNVNTFVISTYA